MLAWRKVGLDFSMVIFCMTPLPISARAQAQLEQPYRVMDKGQVSFQGPGRGLDSDITGGTIKIGLLLPLEGARADQGKLLLQAAQIAVDEANEEIAAIGLSGKYALAVRNESEQWGRASNAIVQLIVEEQVVAVVTSVDGKIAHQAEQIVNKLAAPVLTLSSDPTTTRINIPWIFRAVPSDTEQAKAMLASIYRDEKAHKVLLIVEEDYDGRMGGEEFARAVSAAGKEAPRRLDVDDQNVSAEDLIQKIVSSQADVVVVWSGSRVSREVVSAVSRNKASLTLYLSGKATAFLTEAESGQTGRPIPSQGLTNEAFARAYKRKTGVDPVLAAEQMNLAVSSVIAATRVVGANRVRVRDYLASGARVGVGTDAASFDPAGNLVSDTPIGTH
jgi:branched-chain amino acid transport system substrate-binding protein